MNIKKNKKTIVAYGAPTKATTLMTYFEIDNKVIDFIVDDNPLKQGLYTPLSHIPILHPEEIYTKKPDYILILAWNFYEAIIKKHKDFKKIGDFIIPMPYPKIL